MQQKIMIDTNVYIEIFNSGGNEHLRNPFRYVVFLAYPVLHELWMGAKGTREARHLTAFQNRFVGLQRLVVPTVASLLLIGRTCRQLRKSGKLDPAHPKHYNDITIAALARQVGATVFTGDIKDFKVIQNFIDFRFEQP